MRGTPAPSASRSFEFNPFAGAVTAEPLYGIADDHDREACIHIPIISVLVFDSVHNYALIQSTLRDTMPYNGLSR